MDPLYGGMKPNVQTGHYASQLPGMDMVMDPRIVKKGVEDLRDEIKDLQREAFQIESNMERMQ